MNTAPLSPTSPAGADGRRRLYLVDGSGYIFRAYHALPPLSREDGTPVNAVLGFTNMLLKLIESAGEKDALAVIFDAGRKTFRNEIYPDYKAHRPPPPPELVPQFALVREATRAMNVPAIERAGFEADDLIASYAEQALADGAEVVIVSSDKDLMQLIGPGISMLDPIKNRIIGPEAVEEKFGVAPDKVTDVQALAGDSTDNIPGVPGIGLKTAAELIRHYGSLDALLAAAPDIKQPKRREALTANADLARISHQLVTLRRDCPLDASWEEFARRRLDGERMKTFLKENAFRSVLSRLQSKGILPADSGAAAAVLPSAYSGEEKENQDHPLAPGSLEKSSYILIQDISALANWLERVKAQGYMAFDCETTALSPMHADLVGVSMALGPGDACYIPLAHKGKAEQGELGLDGSAEIIRQIPFEEVITLLRPVLEAAGILKIGHNIKYDMVVMGKYGIRIAPIDDTMLMSYVLHTGMQYQHGMDALAEQLLNIRTIRYEEVTGRGKSQLRFDQVGLEAARDYAAEDADVTLRLHQVLKPRLPVERLLTVYERIERPLIPVIADMETAGVKVDLKVLQDLSHDFARRLAALEEEIYQLAGRIFTIGSPKQLGQVLFDEMKLGNSVKGKSGAYTTDAEQLEILAAQGHRLPAKVLEWRQLAKLKSTYTDALMQQIHPKTGRIHTSFSLAATSTGRLASSDPNLQNIPIRTEEGRKIRHAFVAEPGHCLISLDYSQIELRLAAHMANVEPLRAALRAGEDIHAATASQVFNVPIAGMDPMVRRRAKAINFGIIYGISAFGLAKQLGIEPGEAKTFIDLYFERYPGIKAYMERTKEFAREHGYVTTLFGRRCHFPGIKDKNPARRAFMERAAINAPLQGTAADIVKRAMIRIPSALKDAGLPVRMLLQVHDELVFEAPEADAEAAIAIIRPVMEGAHLPAVSLSVPLVVEAGIARNWAEAH